MICLLLIESEIETDTRTEDKRKFVTGRIEDDGSPRRSDESDPPGNEHLSLDKKTNAIKKTLVIITRRRTDVNTDRTAAGTGTRLRILYIIVEGVPGQLISGMSTYTTIQTESTVTRRTQTVSPLTVNQKLAHARRNPVDIIHTGTPTRIKKILAEIHISGKTTSSSNSSSAVKTQKELTVRSTLTKSAVTQRDK